MERNACDVHRITPQAWGALEIPGHFRRQKKRNDTTLQTGGCMVLGGKTPRKVKFRGTRKYAYQFVHTVLGAILASYEAWFVTLATTETTSGQTT